MNSAIGLRPSGSATKQHRHRQEFHLRRQSSIQMPDGQRHSGRRDAHLPIRRNLDRSAAILQTYTFHNFRHILRIKKINGLVKCG